MAAKSKISPQQADDEISRAAFSLLLKEPFYAHLLAGMPREITDRIKTAAVAWDGQQVKLLINPDFFVSSLKSNHRVAVLKHEVLHIVFRHLFRQADRDPEIDNLAADLVVNQLIDPWPLPGGVVLLESFPDLKLQPDQTVEYYYEKLIKLYREMQKHGFEGEGKGEGEGGGSFMGKKSIGKGGQPKWSDKTSAPKSAEAMGNFLGGEGRGDHSQWNDGGDSIGDTAGNFAVGNVILRARERTAAHQWGSMPGALQTALAEIMEERVPKLDWKRALRIFCASTGKTRIRQSMKRISKRYGTRPGIKIQRFQRLLVAIDTSGSVVDEMLHEFFTEIHAIWRAGATVRIVECDAEVHRDYEYLGKPPKVIEGRGGTEFEPVFQWMKEQRPFDGCLYFTDGWAPPPETRPGCRLLWIIPEDCEPEPLPFGDTIQIQRTTT